MNLSKTSRLATIGLLTLSVAACSTFRGPRPIDPNDDSQFENLPPAPAVEAIKEQPASTPAPTISESVPAETPQTGSASLDAPISGTTIESTAQGTGGAAPVGGDSGELLKIRVYYFGTNLSDITALSYGGLNAHAAYLQQHPAARIQISGHTDERGTREYNLALGERRANAVARFLVGAGANPGQLSVVSYGKEKPAMEGSDEDAWSKNRRVELDYTNAGQ